MLAKNLSLIFKYFGSITNISCFTFICLSEIYQALLIASIIIFVFRLLNHFYPFSSEAIVDIGGAFPSQLPSYLSDQLYGSSFCSSTLEQYSDVLFYYQSKYNLSNIQILSEPGTAIAANAVHLVGHITSINEKRSVTYLNTDLSNTLLGGLKNKLYFPLTYLPSLDTYEDQSCVLNQLAGFSCVEGDLLSPVTMSPLPLVGSKVIFSSVGSYSTVFKSPFIRADVPIFTWDGSKLTLSRRAQSVQDITALNH